MSKNKHLTLDNRITIQTELDKGSSFKEIGLILGKDCTTISKEVRKHIHKEKTGAMVLLASGEISHLESEENDQSQPDRNDQCTSFSFL